MVVVMVGLPARGKTHMARRMARYLTWLGKRARVFNVGNYRREHLGADQPASFFDPANPEGMAARRRMAEAALDDVFAWLDRGGEVALYDATNSTRRRRAWVADQCAARGVGVLFVESRCDDPDVIEANIRETKLSSPDYQGRAATEAVADFRERIAFYERAYEPLGDGDGDASWVSVIDLGNRVVLNRLQGYWPGRLVTFLTHLHTVPRRVFLVRHGESAYNAAGRIGGDSSLTARGRAFADNLARFLEAELGDRTVRVWTSTLRRSLETALPLAHRTRTWRALDEIDAGVMDGLTYDAIAERYPEEAAARRADKLRYRYPRGESYEDVIARLEPVVLELERQRKPVVLIGHQAVLRAIYGYLTDVPLTEVPHLSIPQHTVLALTPKTYGCEEVRHPLPPHLDREAPS